jgi:hypothetical protein
MTHNIIKTENYLLVVDDSKIKQNDFFYGVADGSIKPFIEIADEHTVEIVTWQLNVIGKSPNKKIAAHLPLNNSPVLEGVPLLPPLEDEVEELSEQEFPYIKDSSAQTTKSEQNKHTDTLRWGFKKGYNKAKEKYKYTEFDIIKAFEYGWNQRHYGIIDENELLKIQKTFIQSLQQPKIPFGFECESTQYTVGEMSKLPLGTVNQKPKTTTNPQGQTVWVGKYIY